jgi:O-antigen/teichoic acid export membrane protein
LVGPLQSVIYPDLARLYVIGDQIGLWRKVKHLAWKVGTLFMLLILVVILCVPLILSTIFGLSFNPTIYATQILFIGFGLWLIFFWLKPLYLACGRAKEWAIFIGIYSSISLIGWLIFVPYYGYIALCLWWLLALMIGYIGLPLLWLFLINRR